MFFLFFCNLTQNANTVSTRTTNVTVTTVTRVAIMDKGSLSLGYSLVSWSENDVSVVIIVVVEEKYLQLDDYFITGLVAVCIYAENEKDQYLHEHALNTCTKYS